VGQDENPLALVRCADFSRREYSPRCSVTDLFQFSDDLSEPEADVSFDVLEEANGWAANPNSVCDPRPQMSWVVLAESLSCGAEGLARVASRQDVHFAAKLLPREGLNIRPDRCRIQVSRFHFSDQVRAGERFDLAKSDCSQIWDCSLESEINAAISGAQANVCNWLGSIHVMCVVARWATMRPSLQGQIVPVGNFSGKIQKPKSVCPFSRD
jgi:hypothetical protein